jgi:uncharacterized phiE125 gp8 family phage protein
VNDRSFMNPVVTSPPATLPVTLNEALSQMRYELTETDPVPDANRFIAAATTFVEIYTGFALITRSYRAWLDCWPREPAARGFVAKVCRQIEFPRPPLQSVDAITVYDDNDASTVVDPATYIADVDGDIGRVVLRRGASWPDVLPRPANGIKFEWTAGFGAAPANVPDNYREAILLMVSHFDQHREAVVGVENRDSSTPLPLGIDALLGPPRLWSV